MTFLVFGAFFWLYVSTMAPALAPYRDSGEMAAASFTLSVAHPTSYPSYVMLGHLAQRLPLGNPAYRLNLLSAAAAALACAALFAAARRRWGLWAGLGAAALLGFNGTFWSVAQVQEMYGLGVLFAVGLMALGLSLRESYQERLWRGLCFCAAIALTNRLDLLLWAPGLLWLALAEREESRAPLWASLALLIFPAVQIGLQANWPIVLLIGLTALWRAPRPRRKWSWLAMTAACGAAGLSLYLFLPVRSGTAPWLDWNHPAAPANFLESLLRSRYGGTLDLLSANYATGELFGANMKLYARHLWGAFGLPGLLLAAWGSTAAARGDGRRWLGQLACYWWAGPVFLFIANLPPNPHAAAIVEPHYLLSDVVLVFWAAEGVGEAARAGRWAAPAAAAILVALPLALGRVHQYDRRRHLFSYDFARGVLASAEPGSVVVAKKDVPLYALWSYQTLQGWRPDVRVVAQGLAGSSWYQGQWRRRDPSLSLRPLGDAAAWKAFAAVNGTVYATPDADLPSETLAAAKAHGLLYRVDGAGGLEPSWWELDARRGDYRYEAQPDFFTSDLIDERAQALSRLGAALAAAPATAGAAENPLRRAWSMHWQFPEPALYLGYVAYVDKRLEEARRDYSLAAGILDGLLGLAADYRSLPGVFEGLRASCAEAYTQLGVVYDKLGRRDEAERAYLSSLARRPTAQAHYDLAVLYWGRDPGRARAELEETLRLDPTRQDAAAYLRRLSTGR